MPVIRWNEPGELQLVEILVVVVHPKSGASDGPVVQAVGEPHAWTPVIQVFLQNAGRVETVLIDDKRHQLRGQIGRQGVIADLAARRVE